MKKLINKFCVVLLSLSIIAQFTGGGDLAYAAVTDNTGTSHLELMVGEPNADSSDTLFSLLYDILAKLTKLDTINDSVVAMKESVDKMETSQTNVQYVVNSLAGNQVSITVPDMQNVKSTLSANIDQNANDYIFTDPANGISYSVVNYDPMTNELTLFMRQIIGEYRRYYPDVPFNTLLYRQETYNYSTGQYDQHYGYYNTSSNRFIEVSSVRNGWEIYQWTYPDPSTYFSNFVSRLNNRGILAYVTSICKVGSGLYCNTPRSQLDRVIPPNTLSFVSSNCNDYWIGEDVRSSGHSTGTFYVNYSDASGVICQSAYYGWESGGNGHDYMYDAGTHGVAAIVKLKGNIGDYEYIKDICPDWLKMSNTSIGSTGIEIFESKYAMNIISAEVGAVHTYKDSVHKYKHDLYVNTSENNLTSSVSNALLTGAAGGKFSIPYTSTMSTKTFTNEAALGTNHQKYVDVIIRDPSNNILYFGRIAKAKLGDNLITFTLPNDLQEDVPYLLQMFEESYYDHQGISTISTPVNARLVISNE